MELEGGCIVCLFDVVCLRIIDLMGGIEMVRIGLLLFIFFWKGMVLCILKDVI